MDVSCLIDEFPSQKIKITQHMSHISYLQSKELTTDRYTHTRKYS
jgi:hypothetical protein